MTLVLLFAHHEPLRNTIAEILRREGIETCVVFDRVEARRVLQGAQGAAVRLAIVAYGWAPDGAQQVAEELRAQRLELPLLGIDDPRPAPDACRLHTPFGPGELARAVRELLGARG